MPSRYNGADIASRIDARYEDLVLGSEWQDGPEYLKKPFEEWPWERDFAEKKIHQTIPSDELTSKFRETEVGGVPVGLGRENFWSYTSA